MKNNNAKIAMVKAWEIYKTAKCSTKCDFSLALKEAWAEIKNLKNNEKVFPCSLELYRFKSELEDQLIKMAEVRANSIADSAWNMEDEEKAIDMLETKAKEIQKALPIIYYVNSDGKKEEVGKNFFWFMETKAIRSVFERKHRAHQKAIGIKPMNVFHGIATNVYDDDDAPTTHRF